MGKTLLASVMSTLPVWRMIDPLAVLETRERTPGGQAGPDDKKEEDEGRVRKLFE